MGEPQARVLGARRSASEAVSAVEKTDAVRKLVARVCSITKDDFSVRELEMALGFFTNHNSNYTNVEQDDFQSLLEEVLNNHIRSILVYAGYSAAFGDEELLALAAAFQYNLSVEAVTLSGINISDEAVCVLCDALVRSRVNYLDFSNTPLEDEAGLSLAALAGANPYLRTVVVDDTLITGEILDEIDSACQFNQSFFEANNDALDETRLKESDLGRLKQRLRQITRARQRKTHYCVLHLFDLCPYGDTCIYSHALSGSGVDDEHGGGLSDKLSRLFASGGSWEEKLLQPPQEGAAWRSSDDPSEQPEVKLDLHRRREIKQRLEQEKAARRRKRRASVTARSSGTMPLFLVAGVVAGVSVTTVLVVGFLLYLRRKR